MKSRLLGAAFACAAIVSVDANAALLSFDDGPPGSQNGTLPYDGMGGALSGTNIDFYTIFGNGTPANPGITLDCVGCKLNFTTGLNVTEGPLQWQFGGGGTLTISGTAKTSGGSVVATGTLVSGSFTSASITGDGVDNSVLIMAGFGADTKNQDLIDYFALNNNFTFASTNISLGNVSYFTGAASGGFNGTVTNADFDNLPAVPVPPAVWLFGSGLLGMVGAARRKSAA
jgi:hypothetical protein